jgi:serine/tyrosine/threonine adenylyltransferase
MMSDYKLDFHQTFRTLCTFKPSNDLSNDTFILQLLANSPEKITSAEEMLAKNEWKNWLAKYARRIQGEIDGKEWANLDERTREMRLANPRFVLRQWLLEEIIAKVEADEVTGRQVLAKVLKVCGLSFLPFEK